jgi:hypothetical protein
LPDRRPPLSVRTTIRSLSPGVVTTSSDIERLEVPRTGKPNLVVKVELGTWVVGDASREVTIEPQGFYIADLSDGEVATVIGEEEKLRHAGEMRVVKEGQSMTVKVRTRRRQRATLSVFSVRAAR